MVAYIANIKLMKKVMAMKCFKTSSGYDAKIEYIGGAEAEAKLMRDKILNTQNTEDIYEIKGNKYYINKNMTVDDIPADLKPGDAVLFERGGLWRIPCRENVIIPEGVIFGSYGSGEKPRFYGSAANFAGDPDWEKFSENIWKRHLPNRNAGIIVFDDKYALGDKKWSLEETTANYDFYYDGEHDDIYVYYDGDLLNDFESIEIGQRGDIITMKSNTVLDNVCIRYAASHGVATEHNMHNVTITNCEIGFIGGSLQFDRVRFGNGIEIKMGGQDITVKNNWVYQCYDAGITFQSWNNGKESRYHDIDFSENLIEYCYYGYEFFTTSAAGGGPYSEYKNINISDNIIRFSGYGWAHEQRPDKWMLSHIRGGQWAYMDYCEGFRICNNIFDSARAYIIHWWWHDENKNVIHPEAHEGLTVSENTYYQKLSDDNRCLLYHHNVPLTANDENELTEVIKRFDSNPRKIFLMK